jgi:AcrR family transcriptional regulator
VKQPAQQAILTATLRLIARGGVDAVRYRDVAEAAGTPLGTVSYHYPARQDLIRAAFAWFLADNTTNLMSRRARSRLDDLDDVAEVMAELVRADFADPRRPYLAEYELIVYAARDPEVAAALAAWDRAIVAEIAAVLERLGVPAPLAAGQILLDLLRGFQLASLGRPRPDLDDFRARARRVLGGLAAPLAPPAPPKGSRHARHPKAR